MDNLIRIPYDPACRQALPKRKIIYGNTDGINLTGIELIKRSARLWWMIGITGLLLSCAVKVNTLYDETADYSDYKTFCWFENCEFTIDGPVYLKNDSLTVEVFKTAIVQELERKGYEYDNNNPDFLLHLHIVVEEKEGLMSSPYGYEEYDKQDAFPLDLWDDQPYVYLEGSVIIDIADAEESKMVWRSDVVEYMEITTDVTEGRLKKGIRKALRKFPPNI